MADVNMGLGISFISAGFPSPAEDFTELSISLDKHLIQNPAATFMVYANGNSMVRAGIHNGETVVALVNHEATLKRYYMGDKGIELHPQNSDFNIIHVNPADDFQINGIVLAVFREYS